jgi:WD40 repeat protein/energy-coupling factor transporter ATP-binding protein EcfA2
MSSDSGTGPPEPAENAEPAVHLHQDARVSGGGSAYQAGRDQVFHFEDGTRSAWRADPGAPDAQCPYPGLAAFGPEQAQWFFGREQAIAHLCEEMAERLHRGGLLMVIGASGSGKSSLLRAGLVPAISRGVLPEAGSACWPVAVFTPTAHPLGELSGQLAQMANAEASSAGRIVLVVDQFEEVFALCREEAERQDFISRLCQIAQPGDGTAAIGLVVLGLRADFYGQAARYPLLRDALRDGPVLLDPMSEAELRQAIIFPARAVGLEIEPGLVEVLLRDLGVTQRGDRAGRLPLLAHALRATWQQRRGLLLAVDGYQATGGIERAIATTADRAYDSLEAAAQEAARAMFLRLVAIGNAGNDTRRRLGRADLLRDFDEPGPANAVLDVFTQRRLLTQEQDTVVITHEALLYAWPRLQDWINSDRVGNIVRQDLESAASSWERDRRDSAALYRGSRLVAARAWAATHGHDLSATASAFLSASVRHENRAARTRRTAAILLTALALLASVTAAFALQQRHQALVQSHEALVQRDQAIFGQVITEASQLQATDPSLAAQLNLVAHRMQPGNSDLYTSLINAENTPLPAVLAGNSGPVSSLAFSHDGRILATSNWNHTIQLWDVANPGRPAKTGLPLQGSDGASGSLAFSSRGTLASALDSGVLLWDIADPAHPQRVGEAHSGSDSSIVFSPDGRTLAVTVNDTVGLWNVADPAHPVAIGLPLHATAPTNSAAFSPDGSVLAVGTSDNTIQLWNVRNLISPIPIAKPLVGYEGNASTGSSQQINSVAFSPDGKILAGGSSNGLIRLWNLSRPDQPIPIGSVLNSHDGGVQSIAFSPDGDTLASGNEDDNIELWDVAYPASPFVIGKPLSGHAAEVDSVAFSPNGHILASASWDSTTRLWSIPPTVLNSPSSIDSVAFSQNGRVLAGGSYDGTIRLWNLSDPAHPALLGAPFASQSEAIWSLAFSPDGRILAAGSRDGTVRLWNIANPADPIPFTSPRTPDME